jgi:hypothetical protein
MSDQPDVEIQSESVPAEETPSAEPAAAEPTAEPAAPQATAAPVGPSAGEAWDDVLKALGALSDAVSNWAKAAADTPENRRHVDEVRNGVNDMARQANEAFASVAGSDVGKQFAEGASRAGAAIGETAQEFGQAAAPHVATAFAGLADVFGKAAQKVNETISARPVESTATPAPPSSAVEAPAEPAQPAAEPTPGADADKPAE